MIKERRIIDIVVLGRAFAWAWIACCITVATWVYREKIPNWWDVFLLLFIICPCLFWDFYISRKPDQIDDTVDEQSFPAINMRCSACGKSESTMNCFGEKWLCNQCVWDVVNKHFQENQETIV